MVNLSDNVSHVKNTNIEHQDNIWVGWISLSLVSVPVLKITFIRRAILAQQNEPVKGTENVSLGDPPFKKDWHVRFTVAPITSLSVNGCLKYLRFSHFENDHFQFYFFVYK